MQIGLIVVFDTFDNYALKESFILTINGMADIKVCLVCNSSSDKVFEALSEIAQHCDNTIVVNINRKKSRVYSIRAGARYLISQHNLKSIGFIVNADHLNLLEQLKSYSIHRSAILSMNIKELKNKSIKQTFYQSLFSVNEYLEKITHKASVQISL